MVKTLRFLLLLMVFNLFFDKKFIGCKAYSSWTETDVNLTLIQTKYSNNCSFNYEDDENNFMEWNNNIPTYTKEMNDYMLYSDDLTMIGNSSGDEIFCTWLKRKEIIKITLSERWNEVKVNVDEKATGASLNYYLCCYNNSLMLDNVDKYNTSSLKIELKPNKGAIHYWCEYETNVMSFIIKNSSQATLAQHHELDLQHFVITVFEVYENITIDLLNLTDLHSIEMLGNIPNYNFTEIENTTIHLRLCNNNETHEANFKYLNNNLTSFNNSMNYTLSSATTCFNTSELGFIFKESNMGEFVVPDKACLDTNMEPIKRKCGGNYLFGATWLEIEGKCSKNTSGIIRDLQQYEGYDYDNKDNNDDVLNFLLTPDNTSKDSYFVLLYAKILRNVAFSSTKFNISTYSQATSKAMDFDYATLRTSQLKYNTTDILLESLDEALLKNGNFLNNETTITTKNFIARVTNFTSNPKISGMRFYKNKGKIDVESIDSNQYDTNNLIFLSYVLQSSNRKDNYVNVLFEKNTLFNNDDNDIISNTVSVKSKSKIEDIFFVFKPLRTYRKILKCAYWNYGIDSLWESSQGYWETTSQPVPDNNTSLLQCNFNHLTHFTILIGKENDAYINLFTIVGCSLSLLGATIILISSAIFRMYKQNSRMQILMNFCLSIIIEMITIFPTDLIDSLKEEDICFAVGIILHYSVLSQFCWMLVIGYLQYRKFVIVFSVKPQKLLLKTCLIGWILPLIPVGLTASISPDSYLLDEYCYLTEKGLYLGSLLPIAVILSINFFIFFKIIASITCTRIKNHGNKDNITFLQLRLGILLFFSLGLSWIFGLLAGFLESKIFSYIFCVTCTLQGFFLFIYFVICSIKTKNSKPNSQTINTKM